MKFAVLGGDDRFVRLCRLLRDDGHSVSSFALDNSPEGSSGSAADAARGAGAVILPLPCVKDGALNAPLSSERHDMAGLLSRFEAGVQVFAGKAGPIAPLCSGLGLPLFDYFAREELAVRNAALTAEGAVEILLRESPRGMAGTRVLICGFGRIGRLLAPRLAALGAKVGVTARSKADLAWGECMGYETMPLGRPSAEGWDAAVNTIPARVFGASEIKSFKSSLLLELASAPYGFDAAGVPPGVRYILASGLPGVAAPETAAEIIRDTIYNIVEESL